MELQFFAAMLFQFHIKDFGDNKFSQTLFFNWMRDEISKKIYVSN